MPDNTYPIVLAHGIARFDHFTDSFIRRFINPITRMLSFDLGRIFDRIHYFKGVRTYLQRHGFDVHHSNVGFAEGVEDRARDLRGEVEGILHKTNRDRVHIIAHSMGGLDSRYMIVNGDMADHVVSLTTIGTPHLGSGFADWGLEQGFDKAVDLLEGIIDLNGFEDLTSAACQQFNESAREKEATNSVVYQTYASQQEREAVFRLLQKSFDIIFEKEGENDGLVSVRSQRWEKELVAEDGRKKVITQHPFPVPADHLNELGWWDLNELKRARWWRRGLVREKRAYETRIKDVYLKIAREVSSINLLDQ